MEQPQQTSPIVYGRFGGSKRNIQKSYILYDECFFSVLWLLFWGDIRKSQLLGLSIESCNDYWFSYAITDRFNSDMDLWEKMWWMWRLAALRNFHTFDLEWGAFPLRFSSDYAIIFKFQRTKRRQIRFHCTYNVNTQCQVASTNSIFMFTYFKYELLR